MSNKRISNPIGYTLLTTTRARAHVLGLSVGDVIMYNSTQSHDARAAAVWHNQQAIHPSTHSTRRRDPAAIANFVTTVRRTRTPTTPPPSTTRAARI